MLGYTVPPFSEVVTRQFSGIQFGNFETATNVRFAAPDHHSRFVWVSRGEVTSYPTRFSYVVKFVSRDNGETWFNRSGDTIYRVNPKNGDLELVD